MTPHTHTVPAPIGRGIVLDTIVTDADLQRTMIIMRIIPMWEECRRTLERGYNPLSGREIRMNNMINNED